MDVHKSTKSQRKQEKEAYKGINIKGDYFTIKMTTVKGTKTKQESTK